MFARPVFFILLPRAGDGQRHGRDVVGDGGTGSDVRALAHRDRRDEVRVAADEGVVLDNGAELLRPVVVDGHGAAAEVAVSADIAVAHIGQMGNLGAVADGGVLDFHEVADLDAVADVRARPDIGERTDARVVADGRIVDLRGIDDGVVADLCVFEIAVGAYRAVLADRGLPAQDGAGQDRRADADGDGGIDVGGAVVPDFDALTRQAREIGAVQNGLPFGELLQAGDRIDAVAVGVGHAVVLEEVGEDELVVERLHERFAVYGGHAADDGRIGKFGLVGREGQDDGGAGHNNDVLLGFFRRGEKHVELVGRRLGRRTEKFHVVREERARLALVAFMADQKETPDAARDQRGDQPAK